MNKRKLIGIYGASGFGKEVMPIVNQLYSDEFNLAFIDDAYEDNDLNGYIVYDYDSFLSRPEAKSVVIAISDSKIRERLHQKLECDGVEILSLSAPNSVVLDGNDISDGIVLCPFSMITSNVKIGKGFHCNIYSYVAHDCIIGDFVTLAPSVKCNGNVKIEDHVYIGTGAMIKQGTPDKPLVIGKGAVIGMGAVVTKSVKPGDVVFGNPAKSLKYRKLKS